MSNRTVVVTLVIVGLMAAGGYGVYQLGMHRGMHMTLSPPAGDPAQIDAQVVSDQKTPLYWYDPMVPQQKFEKPGKSPFMDMQLVPKYAEAGTDDGSVKISARLEQNLGLRVATVSKGVLAPTVDVVGSVAYNERDLALVQARANGFIEKLYVRAPLDAVRKGQVLAALYVPEWVAAQEEFLAARRIAAQSTPDLGRLLAGARQRMRLVGMSDEQIGVVEKTGQVQLRLNVTAPRAGVVAELSAREGMTVMAGAALFRINGLSTVWVNADVPESQARWLAPGSVATARAAAYPGRLFNGKVEALLPEVDVATRTLKARVEITNPEQRLTPGMFVTVSISPLNAAPVLLVPTEAVIETGTRRVVIVAQGGGRFAPLDVEVGVEANGQSEIRQGLKDQQQVVVSGQFLIDSEASLKATVTRMSEPPAAQASAPGEVTHQGKGTVDQIDKDTITLSHGPIASLHWGAMTMGFKLPAAGLPNTITVGDHVSFQIRKTATGGYEIATITPDEPVPAAAMSSEMQDDAKGGQR